MAAPIGHLVFAIALLNSPESNIDDQDAFLAGTSFPDIRYIAPIDRAITHELKEKSLTYALDSDSSFEKGRRFHILVDKLRENYMKKNNVYQFIEKGPWATQMLKLVEDDILFEKIKYKINSKNIFKKIYPEELNYGIKKEYIDKWHNLLATYLDDDYFFDFMRYYKSLMLFKYDKDIPDSIYKRFCFRVEKLCFGLAIYFKMISLRNNAKLKKIILGFYDHPMDFLRSN